MKLCYRRYINFKINLLFLLLFLEFVNSQNDGIQLFYNIQAFHFRYERNPDFDIPLGSLGTSGVVKNNLGPDGYPVYCCGDDSKYTRDGRTLLVNNAETFAEWWKGSINETYCENYGTLLPLVLGEHTQNGGYFYTTPDYIRKEFSGRGFNNYTEFPDYKDQGDVFSFCWKTELDYMFIPGSKNVGTISVIYPGEILLYIDGVLKISRMGVSSVGNQLLTVTGEPNKKYHIDIFGCDRAVNSLWEINVRFFDMITMCDINACGTCGYSVCPETCNPEKSCRILTPKCGSCLDSGPKKCEPEGGNPDKCISYSCVEGTGCVKKTIPGCVCREGETCITEEFCFPAVCENNKCVRKPLNCTAVIGGDCDDSVCIKDHCTCTHHYTLPPLATTTTATALTTTTTTIPTTTTTVPTITTTVTPTTRVSTINPQEITTGRTSTTGIGSTITPFTTHIGHTIHHSITLATISAIATLHSTTYLPVTLSHTIASISTIDIPTTIAYNSITIDSTSLFPTIASSSTTSYLPFLCNDLCCPTGYCCIQLHYGYTCVSPYFERECSIERLNDFY
ncbi:hypothetical protein DICPUDRAFT_97512 [Dictyostelium purpureum]|uniref:PA14 domain-containing protein n=1 Tax=Dictyostelium purpureum TaxID=5786 RepID=F0ZH97_DICPU|nr:uncharacterized protein DICPUDRAFT_97512 [Dictyostelium purpureum]EGC36699.1 hypothetical protein DICPUDRAFT_97512 [Dictyostelium purpureum]|eukprot:XP_003286798.1 hypothetical protein DICPUDRAFT_97512 [Dictyostelium purpureum]